MATSHPVSGPIPIDLFRSLTALPAGEALKIVRKYDPLFGRAAGEKIKWKASFRQKVWMVGYATVEAETEEEAERLAEDLHDSQISWDEGATDESHLEEVVPA